MIRSTIVAVLFATTLTGSAAAQQAIGGCSVFPSNNIWNTPVDTLPVRSDSATLVNTIGANRGFHPDFGSGLYQGAPMGIPFVTVPGSQTKYPATFDYAGESDPGPYAVPLNAPIEGGSAAQGDRHALAIDTTNCILYELFYAFPGSSSWTAGSGAIFDLKSNALRPAGWTSGDAAGLPIVPGLVSYDEVLSGEIKHAIRFTAPQTRHEYVWPARHYASSLTGAQYPRMGERLRLKASFDITPYPADVQVILRAMKKYGIMLADNGSAWYISGTQDDRWNNDTLHTLGGVLGSNFEVVDATVLMVDPNSGATTTAQSGTSTPGDVNGDGHADLVWRNAATGTNVVWYLNGTNLIGQGSLPTVTDLTWQLVATADLTGDGHPDAVWRNRVTGANVVWALNGTTFISQASLPTVADLAWEIVASADLNRDGSPDLVWRNTATGANVVWYLSGTTFLGQGSLPAVADLSWQLVAAADFNQDGAPDLIWRNMATGANVVWYLNNTTLVSQAGLPSVPDLAWRLVDAVDLTGDGRPDLVWRNTVTGANLVWTLNGTTLASQSALPTVVDAAWQLAGGGLPGVPTDLTGDRRPDLVWRNSANGANLTWASSGTTVVAQTALPTVSDLAWQLVGRADINGDTLSDLVWRNTSTGANVVWLMNGTTVLSQVALPTVSDLAWQVVGVADVNLDKHPDLIWRNSATGANVIWYLNAATLMTQTSLPTVADLSWTIVASADVNLDGYPDLIWRNTSTGANVVWTLRGGTVLSQVSLPTVADVGWQVGSMADVDGDGHPDLIWRHASTGQNLVWYLTGTTLLGQANFPAVADTTWTLRP